MRLWDCLDEIKDPRDASGRRYKFRINIKITDT